MIVNKREKNLIWLQGEVKSPPFSRSARLEAGFLLRRLQEGKILGLPQVRPMPTIAAHCYELRIRDENHNWRIIYFLVSDAVVILEVFEKKTRVTPKRIIDNCRRRLRDYIRSGANNE